MGERYDAPNQEVVRQPAAPDAEQQAPEPAAPAPQPEPAAPAPE